MVRPREEVSRSVFREEILLFDISVIELLLLFPREQVSRSHQRLWTVLLSSRLRFSPLWVEFDRTFYLHRQVVRTTTFCFSSSSYVLLKFANQVVFATVDPACLPHLLCVCAHTVCRHSCLCKHPLQLPFESTKGGKRNRGVCWKNQGPLTKPDCKSLRPRQRRPTEALKQTSAVCLRSWGWQQSYTCSV